MTKNKRRRTATYQCTMCGGRFPSSDYTDHAKECASTVLSEAAPTLGQNLQSLSFASPSTLSGHIRATVMMDSTISGNEDTAAVAQEESIEMTDNEYDYQQMDFDDCSSIHGTSDANIDHESGPIGDSNLNLANGRVLDDDIDRNLDNGIVHDIPTPSNAPVQDTVGTPTLSGTPVDPPEDEDSDGNDDDGDDNIYDFRLTTVRSNPASATSHELFALFKKFGAQRELYNQTIKIFNDYTSGSLPKLLSAHRSRGILRRRNPIKPKKFDVCPTKGCKLYKHGDKTTLCSNAECRSPRMVPDKKGDCLVPAKSMQYLSLKSQLAMLVGEPETRALLRYRSQYESSENMFKDVFDGSVYRQIQQSHFADEMDIALALFTDDFDPFKRGTHSMMLLHIVILNLPPEKRYKDDYMLQLCVTPGPDKPKDVFSFLDPMMDDLKILQDEGILVKTDDGDIRAHAHLLFTGGDIPACARMACLSSHSHYHGCRTCTVKGEYVDHCMTFPLSSVNTMPEPRLRERSDFLSGNNDLGQKGVSPFVELHCFQDAMFFPPDIMHMLGPNIGKQLWKLISGKVGDKEHNALYLKPSVCNQIGELVAKSQPLTPSSFSGSCSNVATKNGYYRSVDWIHFVLFLVPTIVMEFYENDDTRTALINLSTIFRYACSYEISNDQLVDLNARVNAWHRWLQDQVNTDMLPRSVFTVNQHYLSHLCETIRRLGPLPYVAAFSMERAIGQLKKRIGATGNNAGVNAGNELVDMAALKRRNRNSEGHGTFTPKPKELITIEDDGSSPEIWGPFQQCTLTELKCLTPLKKFWAMECCTYDVDIHGSEIIKAGSRIWKDDEHVFGRGNHSFVRIHTLVDVDPGGGFQFEKRQYFGEIQCAFRYKYQDYSDRLLALVRIVRTKVADSPWPYIDKTSSKLCVINVEDIVGFVGRAQSADRSQYVYWSQRKSSVCDPLFDHDHAHLL